MRNVKRLYSIENIPILQNMNSHITKESLLSLQAFFISPNTDV